jgi:hypothetical protein
VLLAMPRDRGEVLSALRLSQGRWTTRSDVERAAEAIATTAHDLLARAAPPRPAVDAAGLPAAATTRPTSPPRWSRSRARAGTALPWPPGVPPP